ncbi:hypothetical protein L3V16_22790 [Brucella ciceri]|uniref:hypothetical protein n=1 Tax=Brucella ciceri TaxID=391287 RepID=UPI000DE395D6|nr:hypothetical protein [Brucella ciceri]MCH6206651.1 hypothetical protein [Brucella ciceri]
MSNVTTAEPTICGDFGDLDFDFSIPLDDDNRINPHTLHFGRNRFNDPVILGETLGGVGFVIRLDSDQNPSWISGRDGETVFEDEWSLFKSDGTEREDGDRPYSNYALRDAAVWLTGQKVPDFTGLPLEISNVQYFEEHPFGRKRRDVVVSFDINGWDGDVDILTDDHQDVLGEDHANMLVYFNDLEPDEQERYRAVYREIADLLRVHIKANPYHRADHMLSYFMEYGTKLALGDESDLIRYDIPVVTYKSIPKTDEERKANAIPARLVVNRKDTYWEGCVYVNEDMFSKVSQEATPRNLGFGVWRSHEAFLKHVKMFFMFGHGFDAKTIEKIQRLKEQQERGETPDVTLDDILAEALANMNAVDFDFISDDFEPVATNDDKLRELISEANASMDRGEFSDMTIAQMLKEALRPDA